MRTDGNFSGWSYLTALALAPGCYSPNAPGATGSGTVGTEMSSSGGPEIPGVSSGGEEAGTSLDTGTNTTPSDTSSQGGTTTDDGADTSPPVQCTVAGDCGPAELCIDSMCGPCDAAPDPDAACAEVSAETPFCDAGVGCVACTPSVCTGDTPACDPAVGCVPCTEHAQCPDSACHLMGPDAGTCFGVSEVVEVSDTTEFNAEFGTLETGDQRVFHVVGSMPGMTTYGVSGVEVAIIGFEDAEMMGGFTNLFAVAEDGLMYVANVSISNTPGRAFRNDGGLCLDDVDVSSLNVGVLNDGELRLRRSRVTGGDGQGEMALQNFGNGSLFAENSALGPGVAVGLLVGDGTSVDLRYVTIAGNVTGVDCDPGVTGTVRNSIVSSTTAASIAGCGALDWVDNAVNQAGYGEVIGAYDSGWFVNPTAGDFHLTAAGAAAIGDIADWDEGDPLVDIDGDLRPTKSEGRPGLDEP